jgi:peroxiredoxin (alkyl hydroperoxide reductase subunit C)
MLISNDAPDFATKGALKGLIQDYKLSDFKGKWVVLFFYPLDFTFVCPTEIMAYSKAVSSFEKLGAQLLGVSVDSVFTHIAWDQTPVKDGGLGGIEIPLLADLDKSIAQKYDVLDEEGKALRATFIIDPSGVVQCAQVNNGGVGRSVKETLRLLKAYQFTRDNEDVCPAEWEPGDDTLTPHQDKKKEYFKKIG